MPPISNLNIALGRGYTAAEDEHSAHVAIVGTDIVDNVLGQAIRWQGNSRGRRAVHGDGVAESQGKIFGASLDNWVAIPLSGFLHSYGSNASLSIYVDTGGAER